MGALIATVTSFIVGGSASASDSGDIPLDIDLANNGRVTDAAGLEVLVTDSTGDKAEMISEAVTSDGRPARILRQSALRTPIPDIPVTESPDATVIEEATAYEGTLPAELVGTNYTEDAGPLKEEGSVASERLSASELELRFAAALTPTTVSLEWSAPDTAVSYVIRRNGVVLEERHTAEFAESGLQPGSRHEYEIVSLNADGDLVGSRLVPVTTPTTSSGKGDTTAATMSYQPYTSAMVYRTFIPDASVSMDFMTTLGCGQAGQPNRSFSGDNRSWVTPPANTPWDSTSYRSSVFVNVNWGSPAPYNVLWVKDVHPTKLLQNGSVLEQRTASADRIVVSNASSSSTYAQAYVGHEVGNPFCAAGQITYGVWMRFYRSGTFEVEGTRYPVPRHEIYGGWDNGSGNRIWRTMAQYGNEGFGCLTGACGTKAVSASKTY